MISPQAPGTVLAPGGAQAGKHKEDGHQKGQKDVERGQTSQGPPCPPKSNFRDAEFTPNKVGFVRLSQHFKLEDLSQSSEFLASLEDLEAEATVSLHTSSPALRGYLWKWGCRRPRLPQTPALPTTPSPSSFHIQPRPSSLSPAWPLEAPELEAMVTGPGTEEGFTQEP